uniref:PMMG1 n=1 Tax=Pinctada maxima TaxID=104660 RepID=B6ZB73_PINMA|nr:PMMG1 [Pinctada maxima]
MKMRYLTIIAAILFVTIVSCNARKRWWSRAKKTVGIKPEVGKGGNWKVQGSLTISWRKKRDTEDQGKYNVMLALNQCDLESYDSNTDGAVKLDDIEEIFYHTELSKLFFEEADANKDGEISSSEFDVFSTNIKGCEEEPE